MRLTVEEIKTLAKAVSLEIPEDEVPAIAIRLSTLLTAMGRIEEELGRLMDEVDPIPPVAGSDGTS